MDTGDVLYRVSGATMVLSGLFNGFLSFVWFFSLIWVCVGVFWLIPMALAACNIGVGILMLVTGRQFKMAAFAPFMGLIASVCNMNLFGSSLDLVAIGLGIGGFVSSQNSLEDRNL